MRQRQIDPAAKEKLLVAQDYRKFLKILIEDSTSGRGEQAKLSRKAGFFSRSYLSELLAGKKGLSRDSASRLRSALQLPKYWGNYFDCLVWLEHPDLRPKNLQQENIKSKISQIRSDLKNSTENMSIEKTVTQQLHRLQVFQIYAALGTESTGASLVEIAMRTKLSDSVIEKALRQLLDTKAITLKDDRYFAFANKADVLNLSGKSDLAELIRLITLDLQKKREDIVKSPTSLTVYSAFSVHSSKRMALRERLQEALYEVMDEFQDDSGDKVEQIYLNLFHES